jgi:PucR C-terminal helix-turn-helix domain
VLAVLRPPRTSTEDAIHRACSRAHLPVLLLQRHDLLYVIIAETAVAGFLPVCLAELGCPAGVSGVLGSADRMPAASQEAVWALGIAETDRVPLVRYGDSVGLLMPRTPAEAQLLVDTVLGEVLAYDREHATHLVETVRAFVRADGSWQRAAAAVHVHKQTLGYRLHKVEGLTGRGFARTQHLAEWWFALQALDLLAGCRRGLVSSPPGRRHRAGSLSGGPVPDVSASRACSRSRISSGV